MSLFYHPRKANVVEDALSRVWLIWLMYNELVKDIHRLDKLGVRLKESSKCGFIVFDNSESSLVVDVTSKKHLDPLLMEFK